jgi:hypothetical protein
MREHGMSLRLIGACAGTLAMLGGGLLQAGAQQATERAPGAARPAPARVQSAQPGPRPAVKPAPVRRAASGNPRSQQQAAPKPWSIEDALPNRLPDIDPRAPDTAARSPFGRLQLDTGSVGFETQTMTRENEFSDGRPVPGLETVKRNPPSYFGLSLSLPTESKGIIPGTRAPWERRE